MPRRLLERDPATGGIAVFGLMIVAGFAAIVLSWRVVSSTTNVAYQLPALVSGGAGGLGLIVLGACLLYVHVSRRLAAEQQLHGDALLDDLHGTVSAVKARS